MKTKKVLFLGCVNKHIVTKRHYSRKNSKSLAYEQDITCGKNKGSLSTLYYCLTNKWHHHVRAQKKSFLTKNKSQFKKKKKKEKTFGPKFSIILHNKNDIIMSLCGYMIQLSVI